MLRIDREVCLKFINSIESGKKIGLEFKVYELSESMICDMSLAKNVNSHGSSMMEPNRFLFVLSLR